MLMRWLPYVPRKGTLLMLFAAARQRVALQTAEAGNLSDARIDSATEELNQIADDVRDAEPVPAPSLSADALTRTGAPSPPEGGRARA